MFPTILNSIAIVFIGISLLKVSSATRITDVSLCDVRKSADDIRMAVENMKRYNEDYNRLRHMEKRIKTYPELYKAVRAAIDHEDGRIDMQLNRHEKSLQESSL